MEANLYYYRAVINEVYDGDTCKANIDLGMATWLHNEPLRLSRINAPEVRGTERPAGLRSRDFLSGMITGKEVIIQTIKDRKEKYGRYLAEIWLKNESGNWININDLLVEKGYAVYQDY